MLLRNHLLDNLYCVYLNYRHLNEDSLLKLDKAYISNSKENIEQFKKLLDFQIAQVAIITKCNAVILIVIGDSTVWDSHLNTRILSVWDKLSKGGITSFSSSIIFKKGEDALHFIAECALGIHSLVIGDSQVYAQVRNSILFASGFQKSSPFLQILEKWLQSLHKIVRDQTKLFDGNTSIERITCELILRKFTKESNVLVIGLGMSGQLITKILAVEMNYHLSATNRTTSKKIENFIQKTKVEFIPFDKILNNLVSDIVIISINSQDKDANNFSSYLTSILNNNVNEKKISIFDLCTPPLLKLEELSSAIEFLDINSLTNYTNETINNRENELNKAIQIIKNSTKLFEDDLRDELSKISFKNQKQNNIKILDSHQIEIFKIRNEALVSIRTLLGNEGFIEVQTPYIVGISTDPPKVDNGKVISVGFPGNSAFLRQSNQLYKQIIVASGIQKIFEIGPFWRGEDKKTNRHLEETIGLDIELILPENLEIIYQIAYRVIITTYTRFIELNIIKSNKLQLPKLEDLPILTYKKAIELLNLHNIEISYGEDLGIIGETQLGNFVKEKFNSDVFIVINYPDTIKKFYTLKNSDGTTETFDLIFCGWEICSGALRETNRKIIEHSMRLSGIKPEIYNFYLSIISDSKPHGGFGLGFDRLIGKLLSFNSVEDAVVFPRTFEKLIP